MNVLSKIIETKKARLAAAKHSKSLAEVRREAAHVRGAASPNVLAQALNLRQRVNVIAEIKRRSPSKGEIRPGADPATIARAYEAGGAAAISVLTEEDYFDGALDDLRIVKRSVSLPVLRKDFIFDDYQVYEAAACGADALLLIVAALDDDVLLRLRQITEDELGMDALIEVHTSTEMKRAAKAGARVIGVNNRDLSTFEVSLETSALLASLSPHGALLISESGIESAEDISRLRQLGYRGFLIGETLMRASDPEAMLREFTHQRDSASRCG